MIFGTNKLNFIRIRTCHGAFIMIGSISGKSKTGSEVDTHLASPIESIAYGRRNIYAGSFSDICTEPQISKRREFSELQVYSPLNKYRSDPVVKFSTPLHSETCTDKEHRIDLIAVRG